MTDKEQIMINGVDVSKCRYFCRYDDLCRDDNIGRVVRPLCKRIPDCYFKQLARKTQECEELKRKVELMMDCPDCKVDEYKKALEEIEELVKSLNENRMCFYDDVNDCSNCDMNTFCNYLRKSKILNIIDKAKGEGNALYQ